jgi:hypothetical protein
MKYIPPINGDTGNLNRSYINANPAAGIEGSIPSAPAFEHPQREILEVITHAGLTPNESVLTQLRQAIAAMISAAIVAPTPLGPLEKPKVVVVFNGTGSVAVKGTSLGVSSITDNGTGDYTVNFSTAFSSADYIKSIVASEPLASTPDWYPCVVNDSIAAGSCRLQIRAGNTSTLVDSPDVSFIAFGVQ